MGWKRLRRKSDGSHRESGGLEGGAPLSDATRAENVQQVHGHIWRRAVAQPGLLQGSANRPRHVKGEPIRLAL